MTKRPKVTVLGSLNMDISVTVPRLPGPGATVLGAAAHFTPGGKGANQAVAAARLGAEVRMVGCVGDDDFGHRLLAALAVEGVDTGGVRTVSGVPTGLAMIVVDDSGENAITVAPGANHEVGEEERTRVFSFPADAIVISAEIPVLAIHRMFARPAAERLPIRILNLAPVPAEAAEILAGATSLDWLVVNESEAAAVLGRPVDGLAAATQAAADLVAFGAPQVVVTAGAHGAALAALPALQSAPLAVPGFPVTAVDTVGAGDTFVGALAVALAVGVPAADAVRVAAAAGAAAVTRPGAQTAMPRPADILSTTGLNWPVV
jgi:ribokinase